MEMETNKVMKAKSLMVAMLSLSLVVSGCADKNDTTSKAESDSGQQAKQEQSVTISDIIKNKKDFVAYQAGTEKVFYIWLFENGKLFAYEVPTGHDILVSEIEGKNVDDVKRVIADQLERTPFVKNGMEFFDDSSIWMDPQLIVNREGFGLPVPKEQLSTKTIDKKGKYFGKHWLEYRWEDSKDVHILISKVAPEFGTVMSNVTPSNVNNLITAVFGNIDNANDKYIIMSQVKSARLDANPNVKVFITKTKDIPGLKSEDYKKIADNKTFFYQEQRTE